jgi:hypothetical protein
VKPDLVIIKFMSTSLYSYFKRTLYQINSGSHRGHDRMVVGFTTTYAIGAYHHLCCEFESSSGWGVQHYLIKFVSDMQQVYVFIQAVVFVSELSLHLKYPLAFTLVDNMWRKNNFILVVVEQKVLNTNKFIIFKIYFYIFCQSFQREKKQQLIMETTKTKLILGA